MNPGYGGEKSFAPFVVVFFSMRGGLVGAIPVTSLPGIVPAIHQVRPILCLTDEWITGTRPGEEVGEAVMGRGGGDEEAVRT